MIVLTPEASRLQHADDCAFLRGHACSCSLHWRQIVMTLEARIRELEAERGEARAGMMREAEG